MKKILILTTSTGEGHNQAAKSISSTFEDHGYTIVTNDFLKNNSKFLTKLFISGYEFSASFLPKFYGWIYKVTDNSFTNKLLSFIFLITKRKIKNLILKENPSLILATHPFAVSIIGSLKNSGINIPSIVIVTDFIAHSTYINNNIDIYITASDTTKKSLVDKGINPDRIFAYGIPVKDEFYNNFLDIESTKNDDYFNILLMSGSMGLKNISHVLKELLNNTNKLRITVVCGKNEKLRNDLLSEYSHPIKNKKLHILGFSKDIDCLMEYSDIIISKPGGLTVTEAINKHLPLLIPFAIPGQESQNVEFLTTNGYALFIYNLLELNLIINNLINNPDELNKMRENLSNLAEKYSKENIVNLCDKLI
ncbi:MAG: UDP-N-acetylglucosamine--LPS N-acetylglucosamine transferase [Clostridium sp.]|nr:UDP-N-acetylglucosamine--LPS N-acetylglucosamine transferase [Clostridium sp.]